MPNKWLGINIGKAAHNFELFRQTGSFLYHGWYSSIWMVLLVLFSFSNPKLSYSIHFQYFRFCDCVLLRHCFVFHTVNPIAILSDRFTLFPSVYMRTYHFIYTSSWSFHRYQSIASQYKISIWFSSELDLFCICFSP